jgi:hypothetical protein
MRLHIAMLRMAVTNNIVSNCLSDALVNYSVLICGLDKKSGAERIGKGLSWGILGAFGVVVGAWVVTFEGW